MTALDAVKSKLSKLPLDQQEELIALFAELEAAEELENSRVDFLTFVRKMWPAFMPENITQLWQMPLKGWLKEI